MRIASLYDIHGNLPSLEAVLDEVHNSNVDEIVVGGDVIVGPFSNECLDKLLQIKIPVHFIYGNCETAVLNFLANQSIGNLPENVLEDIHWTASQLTPIQQQIISEWKKTITINIEGLGDILFCHAIPRNENENFTLITPKEKLLPIFESLKSDIVVCGHTHMQFDRTIGIVRVINAGSVGMPFGRPGAYWLLLSDEIEYRFTTYDLNKAVAQILITKYPHAQEFAMNNVLHPPA